MNGTLAPASVHELVTARQETVARWPGVTELGRVACPSCACDGLRALWPGPIEDRPMVKHPEDLIGILAPLLAHRDRESAVLLSLDSRHRLLDIGRISVGSAAATHMGPREIYRDALLVGASSIVVAHNHPSGDPEPSLADRAVTRRLKEVGTALGVGLIDHVVIGDEEHWVSLAREGLV